MLERENLNEVVDRKYEWGLYRPSAEQVTALSNQCLLIADLWNALLTIDNMLLKLRIEQRELFGISTVWFHSKTADGPLVLDMQGNLRVLSIAYVMEQRRLFGRHAEIILGDLHSQLKLMPLATAKEIKGIEDKPRYRIPTGGFDRTYWLYKEKIKDTLPQYNEFSIWSLFETARFLKKAWDHYLTPMNKRIEGLDYGKPKYKNRFKHFSIPYIADPYFGLEVKGPPTSGSGFKLIETDNERQWKLKVQGIPGEIRASGRLPALLTDGPNRERLEADVHKWTTSVIHKVNGKWKASIGVKIEKRRFHKKGKLIPITVEFGQIDCLALVNGFPTVPPRFDEVFSLGYKIDELKSDLDIKWPRGKRVPDEDWVSFKQAKARINRLSARQATLRHDIVHVWGKRLLEGASQLTIIKPSVKKYTKSPKGSEKEWGAVVKPVSSLNRNTLTFSTAMVASMLEYKGNELGIEVKIITNDAPEIAEGRDLVETSKTMRRVNRKIKKEKSNDISSEITRT